MRYHTSSQLSEHLFETPEGFLLCPGVAIARTGAQTYAADEVDADVAGDADTVVMLRDPEEVFAPEAIASFEGKPLTVEHPEGGDVNAGNWKKLAVGHVQNVRRGEGADADLLLADILVTDAEAIRLIREEGLRELSCGYDADSEAVRPGVGRQMNISGNHVALVPRGRAGSRCRINDKEKNMAKKKGWIDRLLGSPKVRQAMRDAEEELKDEEQPVNDEDNDPQTPATDEGDPVMEKLEEISMLLRAALESRKTADEDTEDEDGGDPETTDEDTCDEDVTDEEENTPSLTTDRAMRRRAADADTLRRAKALSPKGSFRTTDSDTLVKRMALRDGCRNRSVARVVDACLDGKSLDRCDRRTLDAAFVAASEVAATINNRRTADALISSGGRSSRKPVTPADINAANREFYKRS